MYHQLSNALPSFLSEDNDDDVIQKRKNHKRIGTDGDLNFDISISVLLLAY